MQRLFRHRFALGAPALGVALAGALALASAPARADEPPPPSRYTTAKLDGEVSAGDDRHHHDGVYGRFDGDLFLSLGAGAELGAGTRAGGVVRALWYQTVGLNLGFAQAVSDAELERVVFAAAELRPLFLPRWSLDLEGASPLLDLTLDSLSLGAGLCFGSEDDSSRAAFELSLGLGVPLFLRARGLWLEARAALRPALAADRGQVLVLLSWYTPVVTALVR